MGTSLQEHQPAGTYLAALFGMNQQSPGPGRQAPAGPTEENRQDPSQTDAMPARETEDEPKSNESVEGGDRK